MKKWNSDEICECFTPEQLLTMDSKTARSWKHPYYGGLTGIYNFLGGQGGDPLSSKKERVFMAYRLFPQHKKVRTAYRNYFKRSVEDWKIYFSITIRSKRFLSMSRAQLRGWRDRRTKDALGAVMTKVGAKGAPASHRGDLKKLLSLLHPTDDLSGIEMEIKSKKNRK